MFLRPTENREDLEFYLTSPSDVTDRSDRNGLNVKGFKVVKRLKGHAD